MVVLRVLTRDEIRVYVEATQRIRGDILPFVLTSNGTLLNCFQKLDMRTRLKRLVTLAAITLSQRRKVI